MSIAPESAHIIGKNPQLMGILTLPPEGCKRRDIAVLILSSGLLHRTGPFRLHVDIARSLSQLGFTTLRLDQAGRGDSNRSEGLTPSETAQQEILAAQELLYRINGTKKLIVAGLCSGADDALDMAGHFEDISGIIQLDGFAARNWSYYLSYYSSRLLDPVRLKAIITNRISNFRMRLLKSSMSDDLETAELSGMRNFQTLDSARTAFEKLFGRGGAALCVFTGGIKDYYCRNGQLRQNLRLRKSDEQLTEVFYPDASHTYPISIHREELVQLITDWCAKHFK